ncbi:MAG: O-antigen ligase family protein [Bacteroidales bacterium]|nr:O-antigen ligase family protein [Bacteroidales bacterium]
MRYRIHDQIFWGCSMGLAFLLPVWGKLVPPVIALMMLNWLSDPRSYSAFRRIFKEKQRLRVMGFGLIYLVYLIGLTYTSNFEYGKFDLEVKLSLLLFPLIFSTAQFPVFPGNRLRWILNFYTAGCFTGGVILLFHAWFNASFYQVQGSFYYGNLSWYFHSTYLSMYYNFAIACVIYIGYTKKKMNRLLIGFYALLVLFFIALIFLLASKAGLFILLLLFILSAIFIGWELKNIGWTVFIGGFALFVFVLGYWLVPINVTRFNRAATAFTDHPEAGVVNTESTAERLAIWSVAGDIIRSNFFFGVGTGDVKDELLAGYKEKNNLAAFQKKLNTHNQYLQTFITLGVIGFIVLAGMILFPAVRAARDRDFLYFIFLLIFALNLVLESMLEIQAGVVFYAFFNTLLFTTKRNGDPVSRIPA